METIRNYIDNLFRSYPHTPKVQKARAELLEIMEDKYNELKSQGRSENEAIGIVISEFGNMEEIAAELEADTSLDSRKDGDDREGKLRLNRFAESGSFPLFSSPKNKLIVENSPVFL